MTIPNSVTSLGDFAFSACSSLTNVTFEGDAPYVVGTGIFLWDPSVTVYYYAGTGGWVPSPFVPPPPGPGPPCCGVPGIVIDTPAPVMIQIMIPVITTQPTNVLVNPFGSTTLTVTATGTNLFYQWSRNDSNILNATNSSLILSKITQSDLGCIPSGCEECVWFRRQLDCHSNHEPVPSHAFCRVGYLLGYDQ